MRAGILSPLLCVLAAGCAQMQHGDSADYAARMKQAGDEYLACISREAEKDMKNPAGAEDIAAAAHGRCWSLWDRYRRATHASFAFDARTREERQYAHDKADAHLRQFEREGRQTVVNTVVQRNLQEKPKTSTVQ